MTGIEQDSIQLEQVSLKLLPNAVMNEWCSHAAVVRLNAFVAMCTQQVQPPTHPTQACFLYPCCLASKVMALIQIFGVFMHNSEFSFVPCSSLGWCLDYNNLWWHCGWLPRYWTLSNFVCFYCTLFFLTLDSNEQQQPVSHLAHYFPLHIFTVFIYWTIQFKVVCIFFFFLYKSCLIFFFFFCDI